MPTLLEILQKTTAYLAGKGVPSPKLNAELLLAHALKLRRLDLYLQFDRPMQGEQLDALRPLVQRRGKREPLEYIIGSRPFADIDLLCDRRALVPRSETEELVELLAARFSRSPAKQSPNADTEVTANAETAADQPADTKPATAHSTTRTGSSQTVPPATVLDLGTGTGALALALAKTWPQAALTAVDTSADALALARTNAQHNALSERVTFVQADWFAPLPETKGNPPAAAGTAKTADTAASNHSPLKAATATTLAGKKFDLIVSNPPYLTEAEWQVADPEVKDHEPYGALVAPEEGLADLRKIICAAPQFLAPGGLLALETGIAHHPALAQIAATTGAYLNTESHRDSDGRPRFFIAIAKG